jgi:hypothetical protein
LLNLFPRDGFVSIVVGSRAGVQNVAFDSIERAGQFPFLSCIL